MTRPESSGDSMRMCCFPLLEPTEEEIRDWVAAGVVLEDAAPDGTGDKTGVWRAVVRDPRGFWIALRAEERVLREIFGPELPIPRA